jgi:hypothetical protein
MEERKPASSHRRRDSLALVFALLALPGAVAAQRPVAAGRAVVNESSVSVYARMHTGSDVVKSLGKGDPVMVDFSISTPDGSWCSIVEPGKQELSGYVLCRFLDRDSTQPTVDPGPASAGKGEAIRFQFRPADGSYVQTTRTTRTKRMGSGKPRVEAFEIKERVLVRRTPGGYSMESRVVSMNATSDGKRILSNLPARLNRTPITYDLDANGQLLSVRGHERAIQTLTQALPPKAAEAMGLLMTAESVEQKARAEWDARVGSYAGMEARIGDSWRGTQELPLPDGGMAPFEVSTTLAAAVPCGDRKCVRIEFTTASDSPAIRRMLSSMIQRLATAFPVAGQASFEDVEMTTAGARIVEPETLDLLAETITRTIKMRVKVPGAGSDTGVLDEKMQSIREYGK